MSFLKKILVIISIIVFSMLIIPVVVVNTVKAEAGMAVVLVLFFILNPLISAFVGIISGRDIKHFWFTPFLIAFLSWLFSCVAYEVTFPFVYSVIYFVLCGVCMLLTRFVKKLIYKKSIGEHKKETITKND